MQSTRFPFEDFGDNQVKSDPLPLSAIKVVAKEEAQHPAANENETLVDDGFVPTPLSISEAMESARQEGYNAGRTTGFAEGRTAAMAELGAGKEQIEKKISASLDSLNIQIATLIEAVERSNPNHFASLIHQLALAIAKKVTSDTLREGASDEIAKYISNSLELLFDQPILTVYLHPELEAQLVDRIRELAVKHHFRGEIQVKPDPTLAETDCRLDWHDGFLELSKEDLFKEIQKALGGE